VDDHRSKPTLPKEFATGGEKGTTDSESSSVRADVQRADFAVEAGEIWRLMVSRKPNDFVRWIFRDQDLKPSAEKLTHLLGSALKVAPLLDKVGGKDLLVSPSPGKTTYFSHRTIVTQSRSPYSKSSQQSVVSHQIKCVQICGLIELT
jgi:hypothetical protein